ncbi:TPA: hypothetical protein ACGJU9_006206, partial [Pseudomonas aeruginosa]
GWVSGWDAGLVPVAGSLEARSCPDGEIGRRKGLKICFVKSFLLLPPSRKVNSGKDLGASKA